MNDLDRFVFKVAEALESAGYVTTAYRAADVALSALSAALEAEGLTISPSPDREEA